MRTSGQVDCWGANESGQLADQGSVDRFVPAPAESLLPSETVHASAVDGGDEHTCTLGPGGGVWCWGSDNYGQSTQHYHHLWTAVPAAGQG